MIWVRSGPGLSLGPRSHEVFHTTTTMHTHSKPCMLGHLALYHKFLNLALLCVEVRSHGHMPNGLAVRGLGSLTVLQLRVSCGCVHGARF
jgi:hypothetical protein